LLLNILPEETADRLKAGDTVIADGADDVSVLFVDLVGSTSLADSMAPGDLVEMLNRVFSAFDDLTDQFGLEKIKTVGDAYIAVGGLPTPDPDHLTSAAELALAFRDEIGRHAVPQYGVLEVRIGLHAGPVVAGVIGKRKFSYDIWGDTVNTAARMESTGVAGQIQVTASVRERLREQFDFQPRGLIAVKGKGDMETFLLEPRTSDGRP
ncbi:MAG: adenylate/guanylate cyclase domain-containing protein, partial [Acidimicrobiia bacterium]